MRDRVKDSSVWYLVDGPVDAADLSSIPVNARVLQVTSPDRKKFKEFLKEDADQYFMPVWTHDELEDCRGKLYPNLSADDLTEFERIAGPIPRYVPRRPSKSPSFTRACKRLERQTKAAVARMLLSDIAQVHAHQHNSHMHEQLYVHASTYMQVYIHPRLCARAAFNTSAGR
jgi:hypothetical protein